MWAARRRTVILLIILAFFGLFVVLPYLYTHQEIPTCTDGKMNQDEGGVDCGGSCVLVCPGGAKDLAILWTKVFPVRAGMYNVVAYLENPNFEIGAQVVPYVARLYDAQDQIITEKKGETYALPNERFAIFAGNMQTGEKVAVKGTIEILPFRWVTTKKSEQLFAVEDKVLVGSDRKPKLTAVLRNQKPETYRNIEVTAIIYDSTRTPVGVSATKVEKIDMSGTEKLFFTWPAPFNYVSETEQCELPVDVVLALDRSGSMSSDGKDPPQPLTQAKLAAAQFVDRLTMKDQSAYVSFASEASNPIDQPLTNQIDRVKRAIDRTVIGKDGLQFTNIGGGINRALEELASYRHDTETRPVIVLLTDGIPTRPEDPTDPKNKEYPTTYAREVAAKAKSQDVSIYTIGLGDDLNVSLLEEIATSPEYFYKAASGAELAEVYQQIATSICKKGPSIIEIIPRLNNVTPALPTR